MSLFRICRIAGNTFLEAVRQKFFLFLALIALGLLGSVLYFQRFDFGSSELKFIADFGSGAIVFFGSILSIVMMAQLFFAEIENRTALTILAKPVHRWEFLAGKFCGVAALLGVFILLMIIVLGAFLYYRESQIVAQYAELFQGRRIINYVGLFVFGWTQWLKYCVLISLTLFFASFSNTNLFSVVISFMVLIICQIQYVAIEVVTRMDPSWYTWAVEHVALIFPNFQNYNLLVPMVFSANAGVPWSLAGSVTLFSLVYVLVYLGLAVFSFRRREI